MKKRIATILFCFITSWLLAQSPKIKETVLGNKKSPLLFSFVHITDIHIGEANSTGDFGTEGFFDVLNSNDTGYPVTRLSKAVNWINDHYETLHIAFVAVTGDLTGSAEKSEFLKCKQILDSLKIPYIPLIGNHDVWPYLHYGAEADYACGDSLLNEVFAPVFKKLRTTFHWDEGTRTNRWINFESNTPAYMQNFSFSYNGIRFQFLDFNPRYHVRKPEPGIGPEAQLTDSAGGTLPYLRLALKQAIEKGEKVVLFSHHPPMNNFLADHYAFSSDERKKLRKTISEYPSLVKAWFAGHMHRWAHYTFTTKGKVRVYETKANKSMKNGGFRVVNFHSF